jgi:acyl-coenzyme A synthetase/AMP-(fatty) acid ligase
VIGCPDEEAGEIPKALVVAHGHVEPAELVAFVAARVSPHRRIRRLEFVAEIPKSPSGKILRRVLKEREQASASDPAPALRSLSDEYLAAER